ncbi:uncharacterized protein [Palaemon carinicauda]|uniref:uncharacterized protein n=1 Tax=Palaemon carinicauda TaxID=392227 RepID=UPI0035B5D0E8
MGVFEDDTQLEWRPSMNLDDLRQLIQEGDVSGFEDEARSFREGQPNLADLSAMANDVFHGNLPQYIKDNNYTLLHSMKGGSSDVNGSSSFYQEGQLYFGLKNEGDRGTASLFDFYNVSGTEGSYPYVIGNGFHTFARYAIREDSIEFEVSTLGVLLYKLPSGIFTLIGKYAGVSQGNAAQTNEEMAQASAYTLGSLNTGSYASMNIMYQKGIYSHANTQEHVNSFSVTGGTNCTLNMYTISSPDLIDTVRLNINGNLRNHDKESFMNATYEISPSEKNMSHLFNEEIMASLLSLSQFGADVYLP